MSNDPRQAKDLFLAALELEAEEQLSFLREQCRGDVVLQRQVERLLKAHGDRISVIDQVVPAAETSVDIESTLCIDQTIGPYKIRERIGEGGMGTVYLAEQTEPVRRKVALKVIKPGMDSRQVLARFDAERQALSLMDHPNIARVLDAGVIQAGEDRLEAGGRRPEEKVGRFDITEDLSAAIHEPAASSPKPSDFSLRVPVSSPQSPASGLQPAVPSLQPPVSSLQPNVRPYFVMELVKGVPITEYCDEHQLTVRERLELFLPVCHAIQHAHQKGIIHRDIKPSNVLVAEYDERPVAKVIDFGVAKALNQPLTEQSLYTGLGTIIGTLEYMSPEQAKFNALDIDTRSDVYSLGVLLYELLTGSTPFDRQRLRSAALDEMLRIIREEEPPRPSTKLSSSETLANIASNRRTEPKRLSTLVRGELDWIVMKALEKERNRRYESANSLGLDIQRYLNHEPVLACPPSRVYQLRKFIQRNRGLTGAALGVFAFLAIGITGLAVGFVAVNAERRRTADALEQVTFEQAKTQAALTSETKMREKALAALRDLSDDIVERQMAREETLTEENKEFLGKIIAHFEGMATLTGDDAESRSIRAEGLFRAGEMSRRLGQVKESEKALAEAQTIAKQLAIDFPVRFDFRLLLAGIQEAHGILLFETGRQADADLLLVDALAHRKQLSMESFENPERRHELAESYGLVGTMLQRTGRIEDAYDAFAESGVILKKLVHDFPTHRGYRWSLANTQSNRGIVLRKIGLREEAETAHAEAMEIRRQLASEYPASAEYRRGLAESHADLGYFLIDTGRSGETQLTEAVAILRQLVNDFPSRIVYRQDLVGALNGLGTALAADDRLAEAYTAWAEALDIYKQLAHQFGNSSENSNYVAGLLVNLAIIKREQHHDFAAARKLLDEALPYHAAALEAEPQRGDYRQFYRNNLKALATTCAGAGDRSAAVSAAVKCRDLGWQPEIDAINAVYGLASCISIVEAVHENDTERRQTEMEFYADEAMKMLREAVASGYEDSADLNSREELDPLREREDFQKLLQDLESAGGGPSQSELVTTAPNGHTSTLRSVTRLEKALDHLKATLGPNHPDTLRAMYDLAGGYRAANQLDQALSVLEERLERSITILGTGHPDTLATMELLARTYLEAGQHERGRSLSDQLFKLMKAQLAIDPSATLMSMNQFAGRLWKSGRLELSIPLFELILSETETRHGRHHPVTQLAVANLGVNYKDAGRLEKAIPLLQEAVATSQQLPEIAWVRYQLMDAYWIAQNVEELQALADHCLVVARRDPPDNSIILAQALTSIGKAYHQLNLHDSAVELLSEAYHIRRKQLPNAWETFSVQSLLGAAMLAQGRFEEAEPMLVEGYEGLKAREASIPPLVACRVPEAIDRLIALYAAITRPNELEKYQELRANYPD